MSELQVEQIHALSRVFAGHHRVRPPRSRQSLSLGVELDAGGFGTVYPVVPQPGKDSQPDLLAKLFKPDAEIEAHVRDLIGRLHGALERSPDPTWPERLMALPFLVAQVRFEGEARLMALMLDLRSFGYESYGLDKSAVAAEYQLRPDLDRLEFAYRFACGAQLLESIAFVHADINVKNLLFNEKTGDVQIIDFDAGALVESGDERPITMGRPEEFDFVPPEVSSGGACTVEAERWSTGTMVGMLLFGVGPLFFVAEFSKSAVDAYAAQGRRWPDIDTSSAIFLQENLASYEQWRPWAEDAPGETRERFAELFAAGSDGGKRPTASAWVEAIEEARKPPSFAYLRAEPDVLVEGTEVLVSWRVEGAEEVESRLFGTLAAEGSEYFVVGQATRFEFQASNRYGTVTQATNPVRVVPLPRMERIAIPAFPDLRLQVTVPAAIPSPPMSPPAPPRLAPAPAFPAPLPRPLVSPPPAAPPLSSLPSLAGLFAGLRGAGKDV